jgi:transposase
MSRTDLSERQWRQLESYLPGDPHRGHGCVDHRRALNGNYLAIVTVAAIVIWLL